MSRGIIPRSIVTGFDPDNPSKIEVTFAAGSPAAPSSGATGSAIYSSEALLQEAIKAMEFELTDHQLLLFHLAITWLQPNGSFGNINQVLNKELRFDPTAQQPMRII